MRVCDRNPRWLGIVTFAPRLGSRLVIARPDATEFRVTTPVARMFSREDGVLIETASGRRYLLGPWGSTYDVEVLEGEENAPIASAGSSDAETRPGYRYPSTSYSAGASVPRPSA